MLAREPPGGAGRRSRAASRAGPRGRMRVSRFEGAVGLTGPGQAALDGPVGPHQHGAHAAGGRRAGDLRQQQRAAAGDGREALHLADARHRQQGRRPVPDAGRADVGLDRVVRSAGAHVGHPPRGLSTAARRRDHQQAPGGGDVMAGQVPASDRARGAQRGGDGARPGRDPVGAQRARLGPGRHELAGGRGRGGQVERGDRASAERRPGRSTRRRPSASRPRCRRRAGPGRPNGRGWRQATPKPPSGEPAAAIAINGGTVICG